jgi:hypothetical protein
VHSAVADGLGPRGEQPVQLGDAGHVPPSALSRAVGDLDEELLAGLADWVSRRPRAVRSGFGKFCQRFRSFLTSLL